MISNVSVENINNNLHHPVGKESLEVVLVYVEGGLVGIDALGDSFSRHLLSCSLELGERHVGATVVEELLGEWHGIATC
jgi:hypothetical protein